MAGRRQCSWPDAETRRATHTRRCPLPTPRGRAKLPAPRSGSWPRFVSSKLVAAGQISRRPAANLSGQPDCLSQRLSIRVNIISELRLEA
jgi:hypothetical protein